MYRRPYIPIHVLWNYKDSKISTVTPLRTLLWRRIEEADGRLFHVSRPRTFVQRNSFITVLFITGCTRRSSDKWALDVSEPISVCPAFSSSSWWYQMSDERQCNCQPKTVNLKSLGIFCFPIFLNVQDNLNIFSKQLHQREWDCTQSIYSFIDAHWSCVLVRNRPRKPIRMWGWNRMAYYLHEKHKAKSWLLSLITAACEKAAKQRLWRHIRCQHDTPRGHVNWIKFPSAKHAQSYVYPNVNKPSSLFEHQKLIVHQHFLAPMYNDMCNNGLQWLNFVFDVSPNVRSIVTPFIHCNVARPSSGRARTGYNFPRGVEHSFQTYIPDSKYRLFSWFTLALCA